MTSLDVIQYAQTNDFFIPKETREELERLTALQMVLGGGCLRVFGVLEKRTRCVFP